MRCPRAGERTHPSRPGGAGAPPVGIRTGREELADGERCSPAQGAQSTDAPKGVGRCGLKGRRKSHRKRGPDAVRHRMERRGAQRVDRKTRAVLRKARPYGRRRKSGLPDLRIKHARSRVGPRSRALHPLGLPEGRKGKAACPGPQTIRAMSRAVIPGREPKASEPGIRSDTHVYLDSGFAAQRPRPGMTKSRAILATPSENPKCPPRIGSHPRSAPPRASAR
jgi:hypothetical protein